MKISRSCRALSIFLTAAFLAFSQAVHAQTDFFASINGNSSNGTGFINEYPNEGAGSAILPGLDRPRGIGFDSSGNLYVVTNSTDMSGFHATLTEYTGNGSPITLATGATNEFFESLAVTGSGDVYFLGGNQSDPNLAATIYKISGGVQTVVGTTPGQSFGVALDAAGNLYAADFADQTIYKFDTLGNRTVFAGSTQFAANHGPVGLAFDSAGNLFASTGGDGIEADSILKFNSLGVESASPFATGLTNSPRGLAFDGAGNLFVAETGNGAPGDILEFTPGATESVFDSGLGRAAGNGGAEYLAFAPLEAVPEPATWVGGVLVSAVVGGSVWRRLRLVGSRTAMSHE